MDPIPGRSNLPYYRNGTYGWGYYSTPGGASTSLTIDPNEAIGYDDPGDYIGSDPFVVSDPSISNGASADPAYVNQTGASLNGYPYRQQQVSSCGPGSARNALGLLLPNRQQVPSEAIIAQTMATAADAYLKSRNPDSTGFDISRFSATPGVDVRYGISGDTATAGFNAVFNPFGFDVTRPLLNDRDATFANLQSGNVLIIATLVTDLFGPGTGSYGHFVTVQYNSQKNSFTVLDSGNGTQRTATVNEVFQLTLPSSDGATNNVYVIAPRPSGG